MNNHCHVRVWEKKKRVGKKKKDVPYFRGGTPRKRKKAMLFWDVVGGKGKPSMGR